MSGPGPKSTKVSGVLFLLAGAAFIGASILAHQIAFVGVGVAFLALGVVFLAKARKGEDA